MHESSLISTSDRGAGRGLGIQVRMRDQGGRGPAGLSLQASNAGTTQPGRPIRHLPWGPFALL